MRSLRAHLFLSYHLVWIPWFSWIDNIIFNIQFPLLFWQQKILYNLPVWHAREVYNSFFYTDITALWLSEYASISDSPGKLTSSTFNRNSIGGGNIGHAQQKCPCSHNNDIASIKQISLFDTPSHYIYLLIQNKNVKR